MRMQPTDNNAPTKPQAVAFGAKLRMRDKRTMRRLIAAVRAEKGNLVHAAALLGVRHRTFMKWLVQVPELWTDIEKIRKRYAS